MYKKNPYYPLYLNLRGRKCAVLGGGGVALRKVTTLLKYTSDVTVISPRLCAGLKDLAGNGKIKVIHRAYRAGDLDDVYLAVIATSSRAVNQKAAAEAREKKTLVNVVDNSALSDFIVPSIVNRGNLTLAISTGGCSPSLARKIRKKLEGEFSQHYATLTAMVAEVRRDIKKRGIKVNSRQWQDAIDLDVLIGLIAGGQSRKARDVLFARLSGSQNK